MGPGASVFALDQGSAPPMPLSQVPSTCGYHVQRNSLGLTMLVPYHGCNVVQENGSYVLPMRWQGIPVSLWCPKSTSVPQTASQPQMMPVLPSGETPVGSYPDFPQSYFFSPYLPFPQYLSALPLPTTDSTTFPQDPFPLPFPGKPELPRFPYPLLPFYPFPLPLPGKTGPESNGTTPEKPQRPGFPQDPFLPFYPYFPLPGKPEMPGFPQDPSLPFYPYFPLPGKPEMPGFPQDPFLPLPFNPYFPSPLTGKTDVPTPTSKPKLPWDFHPLFYPPFPWPGQDVPPGFLPSMDQNTATQMPMTPESQLLAQFFLFGSQYPHFGLCDPKWPVLIRKHCSQQKP
ncbi:protein PELPK1-like [Mastacembelus armatus]|uniref:protein PELPK1-like n=1 Tax=Mastacembelus armatus TaxID=205130 RepID=UPI000E464D60|nr:protein PELPK1-like [Mastacembelus armatus]